MYEELLASENINKKKVCLAFDYHGVFLLYLECPKFEKIKKINQPFSWSLGYQISIFWCILEQIDHEIKSLLSKGLFLVPFTLKLTTVLGEVELFLSLMREGSGFHLHTGLDL